MVVHVIKRGLVARTTVPKASSGERCVSLSYNFEDLDPIQLVFSWEVAPNQVRSLHPRD
jgi:hypothetical protein